MPKARGNNAGRLEKLALTPHLLYFLLVAVSGLGFGTISAVVQFANILRESGGPAVVGINGIGNQYFVLTAGE